MVHVALLVALEQRVQPLGVARRAQRGDGQHVGFAALEEARPVHPGQPPHLHADGPNRLGVAAVGPDARFEDAVAGGLFDHAVKRVADIAGRNFFGLDLGGQGGLHVGAHGAECVLEIVLAQALRQHRHDLVVGQAVDALVHLFGRQEVLDLVLGLAHVGAHLVDDLNHALHGLVGQLERVEHHLFGEFARPGLHHEDVVLGAGHHQVEAAVIHLLRRGVDHELAVHKADGGAGDGAAPRNVADVQRGRRGDERQRLHQVLAVGTERRDDDLDFVAHALGEERAQRAIDQTRDQDGLFAGPAFAPEETAGNAPGRVEAFFELHRHGEEVHAGAHVGTHGSRGQQYGVAVAYGDCAACLGGQHAGLD